MKIKMMRLLSEQRRTLSYKNVTDFVFGLCGACRSRPSSLSTDMRFGGAHEISDAVSTRSMAVSSSGTPSSSTNPENSLYQSQQQQQQQQQQQPSSPGLTESSHCIGIDAVKKLRQNYNINKVRSLSLHSDNKNVGLAL